MMSNSGNDLVYYGGDLNYPPIKNNVGHFILDCWKKHGKKNAQIDAVSGVSQTYDDLRQLVIRCALEMKDRGIKKGDVITICAGSHLNLILPWVSAMCLGAVTNPLHFQYSYNEIRRMLHLTNPRMVFCDEECIDLFKRLKTDLKQDFDIIDFQNTFKAFIVPRNLKDEEQFPLQDVNPEEDIALITCTSGTTGLIKGSTITHSAYYISISETRYLMKPDDVYLLYSPLSWLSNTWLCGISWIKGSCKVVSEYNPDFNLEIIKKYKVTWIFFTPLKLTEMVEHPLLSKYPEVCNNIKCIIYGGSPSSPTQISEYHRVFKNAILWNGYGSTEIAGAYSYFDINNDPEFVKKKMFSHGKPAPGVYWKVIDPETGKTVGRNQQGELLVKGAMLTKGYYKDPEATVKAIDEDGWFHTGDMVKVDEDDCIYVVGRYKDLLKYKGWQVPPSEIEEIIKTHPAVDQVCVIGKPHPTDGDLPTAIVKKGNDCNLTEEDLIEYVNQRGSDVQKLRGGVIFIDAFPLTPNGKIRKSELQKLISVA